MANSEERNVRSYFFLFLTALLWGFAFSAQRLGGEALGPFGFNGIRFIVGSLSLVPLIAWRAREGRRKNDKNEDSAVKPIALTRKKDAARKTFRGGLLCGCVLFVASSLQQVGLLETTAGKAAFLTGLYIIFVPLAGRIAGKKQGWGLALGVALAATGLYLLSVQAGFTVARGDALEIASAFFWAAHILLLGKYSQSVDPVKLAFFQNVTCALFCLVTALFVERLSLGTVALAFSPPPTGTLIPLLYSGIASIGIAYTLQIFGQRGVAPGPASLIMSLESVFAAVGGWMILGETMDARSLAGAALMLAGLLSAQLIPVSFRPKLPKSHS